MKNGRCRNSACTTDGIRAFARTRPVVRRELLRRPLSPQEVVERPGGVSGAVHRLAVGVVGGLHRPPGALLGGVGGGEVPLRFRTRRRRSGPVVLVLGDLVAPDLFLQDGLLGTGHDGQLLR